MQPGPYNPPPGAYAPPASGLYGPNVPRYGHPGSGSKRSGCSVCKWCCCCLCFIFFAIVFFLLAIVIGYYIVQPQIPKYDISDFAVKSFDMSPLDFSLKSNLAVTVKADNPNKYVEIIYGHAKEEKDNSIQVLYSNVTLCSGTFPDFNQPKSNVTMIKMDLKGDVKKDDWAQGSGKSLLEKLKNNEKIPLVVKIKLPVNAKFASRTFDEPVVFGVNCTMNVQNLGEGKKVEMSDTKYETALTWNGNEIKNPEKIFK